MKPLQKFMNEKLKSPTLSLSALEKLRNLKPACMCGKSGVVVCEKCLKLLEKLYGKK